MVLAGVKKMAFEGFFRLFLLFGPYIQAVTITGVRTWIGEVAKRPHAIVLIQFTLLVSTSTTHLNKQKLRNNFSQQLGHSFEMLTSQVLGIKPFQEKIIKLSTIIDSLHYVTYIARI